MSILKSTLLLVVMVLAHDVTATAFTSSSSLNLRPIAFSSSSSRQRSPPSLVTTATCFPPRLVGFVHPLSSSTTTPPPLVVRGGGEDENNEVEAVLENASFAAADVNQAEVEAAAAIAEAEEVATSLLVLNYEITKRQIAQNWGFIFMAGTISALGGLFLMGSAPFVGTELALISTIAALFTMGSVNVVGSVLFAEEGFRIISLVMGVTQLALGRLMQAQPIDAITSMTVLIASSVFGDGLYRSVLGFQNRNGTMDGWWVVVLSGIASMVGSAYVLKFLDVSRLVVPGLALGWGLFTSGCSRISAAMFGRRYANLNMEAVDDAVLSALEDDSDSEFQPASVSKL